MKAAALLRNKTRHKGQFSTDGPVEFVLVIDDMPRSVAGRAEVINWLRAEYPDYDVSWCDLKGRLARVTAPTFKVEEV